MPLDSRSQDQTPTQPDQSRLQPGTNTALFKALSHPLRYRIMAALGERKASPKMLATLLDEDFHRVCEQVRNLSDANFIELVGTDTRNGGTEHYYKATVRPVLDAETWDKFPRLAREMASVQILRRIFADVIASVESGVFDARKHRALLAKPIQVDEQGFREADESALRHLDELAEIATRSAARLIESGADPIEVSTATLVFESAKRE